MLSYDDFLIKISSIVFKLHMVIITEKKIISKNSVYQFFLKFYSIKFIDCLRMVVENNHQNLSISLFSSAVFILNFAIPTFRWYRFNNMIYWYAFHILHGGDTVSSLSINIGPTFRFCRM